VHQCHQPRLGRDRAANIVRADKALRVAADVRGAHAALLGQKPQRPQDGVVLAHARHHVVARPQDAVQGDIQRVRGIQREDDLLRIACSDQLGNPLPARGDGPFGFRRLGIRAAAGRRA
jgi:hypothetical protein